MKKIVLGLLLLVSCSLVRAQEAERFRFGLNAGLGFPYRGAGLDGDFDLRYNIKDNINVGVQLTGGILVKDIQTEAYKKSSTASITSSTLFTGDYYFSQHDNSFAPFVGAGLGRYKLTNVLIKDGQELQSNQTYSFERKFGGMLRTGFEYGHFRMAMEYYIAPSSKVVDIDNNYYGTTTNNYLRFCLGFYFGGGHWRH